jgi:hypothetical protein
MLKCSDKSTFGSSPVSQCLRQNHCSFRLEKLFAPTFGCVHCVLVCYVYGLLSSSAVVKFQIRQNIFHLLEKNIFLAGVTLVFCYPSRGHYVLHPVAFFPVFFHCFDRKSMVIYIAHRANIPMVFRHRATCTCQDLPTQNRGRLMLRRSLEGGVQEDGESFITVHPRSSLIVSATLAAKQCTCFRNIRIQSQGFTL